LTIPRPEEMTLLPPDPSRETELPSFMGFPHRCSRERTELAPDQGPFLPKGERSLPLLRPSHFSEVMSPLAPSPSKGFISPLPCARYCALQPLSISTRSMAFQADLEDTSHLLQRPWSSHPTLLLPHHQEQLQCLAMHFRHGKEAMEDS
jgi:hypothetical protein